MHSLWWLSIKAIRILSWLGFMKAAEWVGELSGVNWRVPFMMLQDGYGTREEREEWFRVLQAAKGRPDFDWSRMWRDLVIEERPE